MNVLNGMNELISRVCEILSIKSYPQGEDAYMVYEGSDSSLHDFTSGESYRRCRINVYITGQSRMEMISRLDYIALCAVNYRGNDGVVGFSLADPPELKDKSEKGEPICGMKLWVYYMKGGTSDDGE